MRNTRIQDSELDGRGLFACRDFCAGERIEPIEGEIVLRESQSKYAMKLSGRRTLILSNKTKYVNHSSEPNVYFDWRRGWLRAERAIQAGDELTSQYASVF